MMRNGSLSYLALRVSDLGRAPQLYTPTLAPAARLEAEGDVLLDPGWTLRCECHAEQCRGVVTGTDWQLPTLQAAYAGHFAPFINDRIAAS